MTPDPLLRAGHIACRTCSAVAFPTDASWLDCDHLLVRVVPMCGHGAETYFMLNPAALPVDRRCQASTKSGSRCTRPTVPGSGGWCATHAALYGNVR